ncbi:MAG: DUF362 domain-containing protein [Candidatus Omnitrophica bacterium]|nr:DUF362 domain-containing protein [Candidatus Omnitrophota bacterium]
MSDVYFASARVKKLERNASLPAKFLRLLSLFELGKKVNGKNVCIKMHVGGGYGFTTIHPLFVRLLVDFIKSNGGRPFITDVVVPDPSRGYSEQTIGCRFVQATGIKDTNYFTVKVPSHYGIKELQIAGVLKDADFLINFSHSKGHGNCAYGGAIKNLGMGFVTTKTRIDLHSTVDAKPYWDRKKCKYCMICVKNCRASAMKFDENKKLIIDFHACVFCMRCVALCPQKALRLDSSNYEIFQRALALAAKKVLDQLDGNYCHINVIMNVTPFCDCLGISSPPIIPDAGIASSYDIVSLEKATLDLIDKEKYIDGTLPGHLRLEKQKGHLFERIWGKDPYIQVFEAAKLKMGDLTYKIVEIK